MMSQMSARSIRNAVLRSDPYKLLSQMGPEIVFTYIYHFYRSIALDPGLSTDEGNREFAQMADVAADFILDAYKLMYSSFITPSQKEEKILTYLDPDDILTYLFGVYASVSKDPGILYSDDPNEQDIAFAAGTMTEYINQAYEVLYGKSLR